MTATNHAITGAIIAMAIDKPAIALPLAFLSHFAQDTIPHFGYPGREGYKEAIRHKSLKIVMAADVIFFLPLLFLLVFYNASFWVYLASFLALSPDFHDFIAFFLFHRNVGWNWFSKITEAIQWCERPWGITVEIIWYVGGMALLIHLLR